MPRTPLGGDPASPTHRRLRGRPTPPPGGRGSGSGLPGRAAPAGLTPGRRGACGRSRSVGHLPTGGRRPSGKSLDPVAGRCPPRGAAPAYRSTPTGRPCFTTWPTPVSSSGWLPALMRGGASRWRRRSRDQAGGRPTSGSRTRQDVVLGEVETHLGRWEETLRVMHAKRVAVVDAGVGARRVHIVLVLPPTRHHRELVQAIPLSVRAAFPAVVGRTGRRPSRHWSMAGRRHPLDSRWRLEGRTTRRLSGPFGGSIGYSVFSEGQQAGTVHSDAEQPACCPSRKTRARRGPPTTPGRSS